MIAANRAASGKRTMPLRSVSILWSAIMWVVAVAQAADSPLTKIDVIAHRGAHQDAPENSLTAIRKAIEIGCDFVEIDIRTTSDGRLILMHDRTVDRTTDGRGPVEKLTYPVIRRLRFGSQWSHERVPTLEEAIIVCKGRVKIYIDHKQASPAQVLKVVRAHKMLSDVIVYSDVDTLREYKRLCQDIWIMPPHPKNSAAIRKLVDDLHPETLNGNITEWTAEQVKVAHELGVQVGVDNPPHLDSEAGVRAAIEMGIDALQTDHPKRVIEILESLGARRK